MSIERVAHIPGDQLRAGLAHVLASPADAGTVELIAVRPRARTRELLETAELDLERGVVGDRWGRGGRRNPDLQVTLMSARVAALVAGGNDPDSWAQAGDQLYVDLDFSSENLPPGTRLGVGEKAVLEITPVPHTGCGKFVKRFGVDAMKFVNSAEGRELRLRGVNARVVTPGTVSRGDPVRKL